MDNTAASWDPTQTVKVLEMLGIVALVSAMGAAWHIGEPYLMRYAQSLSAMKLSKEDVTLTPLPRWISPMLQDQLRDKVASELDTAMEHNHLDAAARQLAGAPWVKRVMEIRRVSRGRVVVEAAYRQPLAVVRGINGYHLVDDEGVRLPGLYSQMQLDQLALPVLVGTASGPPPVGSVWPGQDLQAGLSLAGLLMDQPFARQIQAIDVGQRDTRGRVRLALLTRGAVVRWGLPPDRELAIEPDAQTKLSRIARLFDQRAFVEGSDQVVDIYGPAVFVRPMSEADDTTQRPPSMSWSRPASW